ncbi:unnamed protein product [Caenorhabditis bovis]|uniref:Uncharacterized protein n=1 Tax=Caenorhabditis bovis TaxID=2654633 RepID=A0A8S1F590_9PELO|nr:unnamed protein product [Caenorhabditis bovis]
MTPKSKRGSKRASKNGDETEPIDDLPTEGDQSAIAGRVEDSTAAPDECAPVSPDVATQADLGSPPAKKTRFGVDRGLTREELEHMIAEIESRSDKKWHQRTMRALEATVQGESAMQATIASWSKTLQNDVGRVATDTSHIRTKTVELAMEVAEMRRALGREKQAHQDVLLMLQQLREEHVTLNKQLAAVLASATSEPKVTIGGAGKPEKVITCTLCAEDHKEELCQKFPTATDRLLKAIEAELCLKCARHSARVKCRHQRLKCPRCGSEAHLQYQTVNTTMTTQVKPLIQKLKTQVTRRVSAAVKAAGTAAAHLDNLEGNVPSLEELRTARPIWTTLKKALEDLVRLAELETAAIGELTEARVPETALLDGLRAVEEHKRHREVRRVWLETVRCSKRFEAYMETLWERFPEEPREEAAEPKMEEESSDLSEDEMREEPLMSESSRMARFEEPAGQVATCSLHTALEDDQGNRRYMPEGLATYKLPSVEIPMFDGNVESYAKFRNIFLHAVSRNTQMDPTSKFVMLQSKVTGRAEVLLEAIEPSDEAYAEAWRILERRFNTGQTGALPQDMLDLLDRCESILRRLNRFNLGRAPMMARNLLAKFPASIQARIDRRQTKAKYSFDVTTMLEQLQEVVEEEDALHQRMAARRPGAESSEYSWDADAVQVAVTLGHEENQRGSYGRAEPYRNDDHRGGRPGGVRSPNGRGSWSGQQGKGYMPLPHEGRGTYGRPQASKAEERRKAPQIRRPQQTSCPFDDGGHWPENCPLTAEARKAAAVSRRGHIVGTVAATTIMPSASNPICFFVPQRVTSNEASFPVGPSATAAEKPSSEINRQRRSLPPCPLEVGYQVAAARPCPEETVVAAVSQVKGAAVPVIKCSGADQTLVTQKLADELGLEEIRRRIVIVYGVGDSATRLETAVYNIPWKQGAASLQIMATAIPRICHEMRRLYLPDGESEVAMETVTIDLLLGMDHIADFLRSARISRMANGQILLHTPYGDGVCGRASDESLGSTLCLTHTAEDFDIAQMWSLDFLGIQTPGGAKQEVAENEQVVKEYLEKVVVRDGEIHVALPFNGKEARLHSNYAMAHKRLVAQFHALRKEPDALEQYDQTIASQLASGIIEGISGPSGLRVCRLDWGLLPSLDWGLLPSEVLRECLPGSSKTRTDDLKGDTLTVTTTALIPVNGETMDNEVVPYQNVRTLTRLAAIMRRVAEFARQTGRRRIAWTGPLMREIERQGSNTTAQIRAAELWLIVRHYQDMASIDEFRIDQNLNPRVDPDGIIRCVGRLKNAYLHLAAREPILILSGHPLARLVINEAHEKSMHHGREHTMAAVRERFWITAQSSCSRVETFLESWQFIATATHLFATFSLPLEMYAIYLIVTKTPSHMGNLKGALLQIQFWLFAMDFVFGLLIIPYIMLPCPCGTSLGILRAFGVPMIYHVILG